MRDRTTCALEFAARMQKRRRSIQAAGLRARQSRQARKPSD